MTINVGQCAQVRFHCEAGLLVFDDNNWMRNS